MKVSRIPGKDEYEIRITRLEAEGIAYGQGGSSAQLRLEHAISNALISDVEENPEAHADPEE